MLSLLHHNTPVCLACGASDMRKSIDGPAANVQVSFAGTISENALNPLTYPAFVFEQLPNIDTTSVAALDLLLPWSAPIQAKFAIPAKRTV